MRIVTLLTLTAALAVSADAQTIKPIVNGAAINASRAPSMRVVRTPALPKPAIAASVQRTLNMPAPPPINDVAVLDMLHLASGGATLSLWNGGISHHDALGPVGVFETGSNGSTFDIAYPSSGVASALDCTLSMITGESTQPNGVALAYTVYKPEGGNLKPLHSGSAPITNSHAVTAVPSSPAGTRVVVRLNVPSHPAVPSGLYYFQGCRVYKLG